VEKIDEGRREFLKGFVALCGLGAMGAALPGSAEAKAANRESVAPPELVAGAPSGVRVGFENGSEHEVSPEDVDGLFQALDKLHQRFPNMIEQIRIIPSRKTGGFASAAIDRDSHVRTLLIDTDFLRKESSVLEDIVFHEAGHIVYSAMRHGYRYGSPEYVEMEKRRAAIDMLAIDVQSDNDNQKKFPVLFQALLEITYLGKRTSEPGTYYDAIPNGSELYAMAFCIRELYAQEFEELIARGSEEEQRKAREIMALIPDAEIIRLRVEEISKQR
jgi:hypothetical protein